MTKSGKKSQNIKILSSLYQNENFESKNRLSKIDSIKKYFNDPKNGEKWLARVVLFFGFVGIIFGFFHFRNQIRNPYLRAKSPQISQQNVNQDLLGLSQKDTDSDGLSDYEELYIYGSSPYLEDSDSDGINDQKEIASGSDPNCPQGQNCLSFQDLGTQGSQEEASGLIPSLGALGNLFGGTSGDATQLRELLSQAGMSEEVLSSFTDEELLAAYQDVLTQSGGSTGQSEKTVTLPTTNIEELTPQQIRQLLKESGIDEQTLNKISDEELMQLVQETLQETQ